MASHHDCLIQKLFTYYEEYNLSSVKPDTFKIIHDLNCIFDEYDLLGVGDVNSSCGFKLLVSMYMSIIFNTFWTREMKIRQIKWMHNGMGVWIVERGCNLQQEYVKDGYRGCTGETNQGWAYNKEQKEWVVDEGIAV